MAKVKFYLEIRKNEKLTAPILLFFSFNGKRFQYYTGERISIKNYEEEYWKRNRRPVKAQEKRASAINTRLEQMESKVYEIRTKMEGQGIPLSTVVLREELDKVFKGKEEIDPNNITVKKAYEEYIKFMLTNRTKGTYQKHCSTKLHFETYLGDDLFNKLKFNDINDKLIDGFKKYFIDNGYKTGNEIIPYSHNTMAKYLNSIGDFFNWAKNDIRGYYRGNLTRREKEEDVQIFYLTLEELKKIELTDMPTKSLEKMKDVYLFTCYAGIRFTDVKNLRKDNVKDGILEFFIQKNRQTIPHTIPLTTNLKKIIEKYKNSGDELLLPVFSNPICNKYLKEVLKISKIDEPVKVAKKLANGKIIQKEKKKWEVFTFHHSRKTLITNMIAKGTNESLIKSITGHSKNSRAFGKYYKIEDNVKLTALENVFGE